MSQNIEILHKRRNINCKPAEEKAKSTQELKSLNFKSSKRKETMKGKAKENDLSFESKELNKSNC